MGCVWVVFEILDRKTNALRNGLPVSVVVIVDVLDSSAEGCVAEIPLDRQQFVSDLELIFVKFVFIGVVLLLSVAITVYPLQLLHQLVFSVDVVSDITMFGNGFKYDRFPNRAEFSGGHPLFGLFEHCLKVMKA